MNRRCSKCGLVKLISEFYIRKTGARSGQAYEKCRLCMKQRGVLYYHLNHERQLKLALIRKNRAYKAKREYINDIKNCPCVDCKRRFPSYVMDFDHKGGKLINVANMVGRGWSMKKIVSEVGKCEVVCANCHRIRTYGKHAMVAKVVTAGL